MVDYRRRESGTVKTVPYAAVEKKPSARYPGTLDFSGLFELYK